MDSTQSILKIDITGKDAGSHIQVYMPYLEYMEGPRNNLIGKYGLTTLMEKTKPIFYDNKSGTIFASLSFEFLDILNKNARDTVYDVTADIIKGDKADKLSKKYSVILEKGCVREKNPVQFG